MRDLATPEAPVSVVGLLTRALALRRAKGAGPLTIVCCDNLPHNGKVLQGIVQAFATAHDPSLARWIDGNAAFPSTMVDRIVPATTAADIADNDAALGVHDAAPVVFEPFAQWVIERTFATPRPQWEVGGAQFVDDVAPFEAMKLRLLNASHSAFAYLGFLAGHEYIYQVAAQPDFVAFMRRLMQDEVTPTLVVPPDTDLAAYREALITRFGNPALPHRTQQIAMDGSQKLPQRLLATTRENLAAGRSVRLASLAVAGWMRYVAGVDEKGNASLSPTPSQGSSGRSRPHIGAILPAWRDRSSRCVAVFGDDLPHDVRFTAAVAATGCGALRRRRRTDCRACSLSIDSRMIR